jgi:hypothetical protein
LTLILDPNLDPNPPTLTYNKRGRELVRVRVRVRVGVRVRMKVRGQG